MLNAQLANAQMLNAQMLNAQMLNAQITKGTNAKCTNKMSNAQLLNAHKCKHQLCNTNLGKCFVGFAPAVTFGSKVCHASISSSHCQRVFLPIFALVFVHPFVHINRPAFCPSPELTASFDQTKTAKQQERNRERHKTHASLVKELKSVNRTLRM